MNRFISFAMAASIAMASTGCAMIAPQYTASLDNVQTLKDSGTQVAKVGAFTAVADKANANPISIRGSTLASPYQESYANYVAEAIKQELSLAKKLSPDATVEITGTLLKNDIDASGFTTGTADVEARFVVKRANVVNFDKVKSAHIEFPSSFAGAIAIPRAVQAYSDVVQKLLTTLYADPAFISAIRP